MNPTPLPTQMAEVIGGVPGRNLKRVQGADVPGDTYFRVLTTTCRQRASPGAHELGRVRRR